METPRTSINVKVLLALAVFFLVIIFTYKTNKYPVPVPIYHPEPATTEVTQHSTHRPTTSESTTKPRHIIDVNEEGILCETSYLGCFETAKSLQKDVLVADYKFMTVEWCVAFCQSNSRTYAGISVGRCMCSTSAYHFASIETPTDECRTPCPGDGSEICGGESSTSAYFIRGTCLKAPFETYFVETRYKGCFSLPEHQQALKYYGDTSEVAMCFLFCEKRRDPLAAFDTRNRCFCGRMTNSFNLTHKTQSEHCNSTDSVRVFRTMADDERCSKIRLLSPGKHNLTMLASFPGSGNTWTRFLLERATGYYTGSVYNDASLVKIGYLGEEQPISSERVDVIKDHLMNSVFKRNPRLKAAILVVRNPYHAFLAYAKFMKAGHVGTPMESVLKTVLTLARVRRWISDWTNMLPRILKANMTLKVIYFEDMVADPIASVREMVEFLPNPLLHPRNLEERLACLSQDTTGLAKRKSHDLSFNPFPEDTRSALNDAVMRMREALKRAGVGKELPPYEEDAEFALPPPGNRTS